MFSISVVLCVVGSHDSTIDCLHIIIINGFLCSVLLLDMQLQSDCNNYLVERRSKKCLLCLLRKGRSECDTSEKGEDLSNDYVYRKGAKLVTEPDLCCVFKKQGGEFDRV